VVEAVRAIGAGEAAVIDADTIAIDERASEVRGGSITA
jgi:hypothetical protein